MGDAPTTWENVTGVSMRKPAGADASSGRYGSIIGAQRKARRVVEDVAGIGNCPPGSIGGSVDT